MSHLALRRLMVRMVHDAAFADRVRASPAGALAEEDLTADERRWLAEPPAAAWRTDPDRPRRVLAALLDEFPVAASLALEHAHGFFASPSFHGAVQHRGSLALALGGHFAGHPDAAVRSVAAVETAVAAVRRAPRSPGRSGAGRLRLTCHARLVRVAGGTLALIEARRHGVPATALAGGEQHVLVARHPPTDEVTLEEVPPALAGLLSAATTPRSQPALLAEARRLGADPGEDEEIVAGLVKDGLLI